MKTLWIHHLQSIWDSGYRRNGTSFEELLLKVANHIKKVHYDKIILTQFENYDPEDEHCYIIEAAYNKGLNIQFIEYGYGWSKDCFIDSDAQLIPSKRSYSTEDDVIFIDDFLIKMKERGDIVSLCGAFKGECLLDAQTVLRHLKIKFKTISSLSV